MYVIFSLQFYFIFWCIFEWNYSISLCFFFFFMFCLFDEFWMLFEKHLGSKLMFGH